MTAMYAVRALLAAIALSALPVHAQSFEFSDTGGKVQSLAAYRGKWVLLNMWASWCAPCIIEMPVFEALSKERADLVVLGLAADGETPAKIQKFAAALKVTYPIGCANAELTRRLGVQGFPTTLLFNPKGELVKTIQGAVTRPQLEALLPPRAAATNAH
ncbi:MAG: TlpA disulfide reductase family protein [Massilia sp.]